MPGKQVKTSAAEAKASGKSTDAGIVQESLRPYAIADKLRTLRLRRNMGLAQLAESSDILCQRGAAGVGDPV